MILERSKLRPLVLVSTLLVLLAGGVVLANGMLQTVLFVILAFSAIVASAALWPEVLVMAFLFAGRHDFEPRLAPFDAPLSLNQLMLVGLVGLALVNAAHLGRVLRTWSMATMLIFGLTLALGLGWSYGLDYGVSKVTRTWLVVIPGVLIAATLVERRRSLLPLVGATFIVGFALNAAGLLTFEQSMVGNRLSALGSGPIIFARTVGLSLLISLLSLVWFVQNGARTARDRLIVALCLGSVAIVLPGFVLAQSRGPVLGLAAAMTTVLVLALYGNWRVIFAGIGLGYALFRGSAIILTTMLDRTRFDLTQKSNQAGLDGRMDHLSSSWNLIVSHPLMGVGTGGWPVSIYGIDERAYPHNFFAEVASENGVPMMLLITGLFAFVILRGFLVWFRSRAQKERFVLMCSLATFMYFAVNISVTGDSIDNRLVWLSVAAVELSARFAKTSTTRYRTSRVASPAVAWPRPPVR